jgi:hypothetical protein
MTGSRSGGSLSGLRGGPGSLSYASSADSRGNGAHRRGQRGPSPIHIEARAGAVFSHSQWEGHWGEGSAGDRVQGHQAGDRRDPRLDSLAPPRGQPAPHEAARRGRHGPYRRYKPRQTGTGLETPSPRSFAPPGSRRSETRRQAVASAAAACPLQHPRGCEATLPCREDAGSSLEEGRPSLSQTIGPLRGVRLASQRTWEVQCRSFKAEVLVLSEGLRVVCSNGFITRVCSKEAKDGLILFRIFGECLV